MLSTSSQVKNEALAEMAASIEKEKDAILKANKKDLKNARSKKLPGAFIERLRLCDKRIGEMGQGLIQIAGLKDPVGEIIKEWSVPNGLRIQKVRTPIGVIAIIYESRPNVTSDCAGLCFKSGNCVILRGGSDALNSNFAIYQALKKALDLLGFPEGIINIVTTANRLAVDELLKLNGYIDLVIPRGGEALIEKVARISKIPAIKHYKGICHVYVDEWAELNMATEICFNAKVQRPGVCNAMESMLVHKDAAARFLPLMLKKFKEAGVEIRGCKKTQKIAKGIKQAADKDYRSEYLDLILSVKVVEGLDEAISHINEYGSHHSDAIVTDNKENAGRFFKEVDSACVYLNASTRFTDGGQFGMGAEIGISTDKLHARGPMGLEELTTYKYMVFGEGQIRS